MVGVATTEYCRDLKGTEIGKTEVARKASSPMYERRMLMKFRAIILSSGLAASMLLIAVCGGGGASAPAAAPRPTATTAPPSAQAPSTGGYQETTVTNGGIIAGAVRFTGTAQQPEPLEVNKDIEVCGTSKLNEKLLVSSGGGIKNAVVSIKDMTSGKAMNYPTTAKLGQKDCSYTPRVLIGQVDGSLEVRNDDPLMHNVHSFTFDNPSINRAQPKGSDPITTALELPEIVEIGCDIHGWMTAWLVVAEHPYYVITGEDGSFSLADVPPGTYQVEVWHETLGTSSQTVTVAAGETAVVSFALAR